MKLKNLYNLIGCLTFLTFLLTRSLGQCYYISGDASEVVNGTSDLVVFTSNTLPFLSGSGDFAGAGAFTSTAGSTTLTQDNTYTWGSGVVSGGSLFSISSNNNIVQTGVFSNTPQITLPPLNSNVNLSGDSTIPTASTAARTPGRPGCQSTYLSGPVSSGAENSQYPSTYLNSTFEINGQGVTVDDYCNFLNAVATVDTYHLFRDPMGEDVASNGGPYIIRYGTPDHQTYQPVDGKRGELIASATACNMARYCNWLYNGQPSGPQGPDTTETGAYLMGFINDDEEFFDGVSGVKYYFTEVIYLPLPNAPF